MDVRHRCEGCTLVELLVSIVLVVTLAVIALPRFLGAPENHGGAHAATLAGTLEQLRGTLYAAIPSGEAGDIRPYPAHIGALTPCDDITAVPAGAAHRGTTQTLPGGATPAAVLADLCPTRLPVWSASAEPRAVLAAGAGSVGELAQPLN